MVGTDKENGPAGVATPRDPANLTRRLTAMTIAHPAHPSSEDHGDTVETHYASLKRLECASCFGGYVTITVEEDGQEHDEAVPCRRCAKGK